MLVAAAISRTGIMAGAIVAVVRLVESTGAANGLAVRTLHRRRQNHFSKKKRDHADERQQQNSKMYPTGLGHLTSPPFPRPGHQFDSTRQA